MKNRLITIIAVEIALLSACGNDPGPLDGTWKSNSPNPMMMQFRGGEAEVNGMGMNVSYEVNGNDVIVTYNDGFLKGTKFRYTITGPDTLRAELGTFQRVK